MGSATEAIIIAGGYGTRMQPLTGNRPKHLLELAGVPLLAHQLATLHAAGIERVVLATSYHSDQFEPIFGAGEAHGLELEYSVEDVPLGTGGAMAQASASLRSSPDDAVLIVNGDVLSGHSVVQQIRSFFEHEAEVSLHLVQVEDARAFGCVPTDAGGWVTAFEEKTSSPRTNQVNAGTYIFRRRTLDAIPRGREVSVERETFPGLLARGVRVLGHLENAYWRDVGNPSALLAASADVVTGRYRTPAYSSPGPFWHHPTAVVEGTLINGASVLAGATVAVGAVIDGSVVMAGARVGPGARVLRSVIGRNGTVVAGADIVDRAGADGEVLA